jgi:hypothetical protein
MRGSWRPLKAVVIPFFEWFGELGLFCWRLARVAVSPPFEFGELARQMDSIGSMSLPLVALVEPQPALSCPCRPGTAWRASAQRPCCRR